MGNAELSYGRIVITSKKCMVKGQAREGIPTLIWPEGIDEAASDWLRALVVEYGVSESSAYEYAKIIRPFLRFCRKQRRKWDTVDDEFLILWRGQLLEEKTTVGRVNTVLNTVFAFYRWAEETKRIRYQVGIYTEDELPVAHHVFPISAKRCFTKGRNGRVYREWTTPLTLPDHKKSSPVRHTPSEGEIRTLHEIVANRLNAERDSLMFSWAEEAGPRRAEFMSVGKSQMPTSQELARIIELDQPWTVDVIRKGGASKHLNVPPDLILRTLDYIEFGRADIVNKCRKKFVGYREPDEIFLSSSTGLPLHLDSVTSMGRRTFVKAGIKRANIHRLRARFAVRTIETLVESIFDDKMVGPESTWIDTILIKAAESMGHSDPSSLRPYLTYVLNRRIQLADANRASNLEVRIRQLQLHEGTVVRRLQQHADLHQAAIRIRDGDHSMAAAALREIADQLDGKNASTDVIG